MYPLRYDRERSPSRYSLPSSNRCEPSDFITAHARLKKLVRTVLAHITRSADPLKRYQNKISGGHPELRGSNSQLTLLAEILDEKESLESQVIYALAAYEENVCDITGYIPEPESIAPPCIDADSQIGELTRSSEMLRKQNTELRTKVDRLNRELDTAQSACNAKDSLIFTLEHRNTPQKPFETPERADNESFSSLLESDSKDQQIERLKSDINKAKKDATDIAKTHVDLKDQVSQLSSELDEARNTIRTQEAMAQSTVCKETEIEQQKKSDQAQAQIEGLASEVNEALKQVDQLTETLQARDHEIEQLKLAFQEPKETLRANSLEIDRLQEQLVTQAAQIGMLKEENLALSIQLQSKGSQVASSETLDSEYRKICDQLDASEISARSLRDQIDSLHSENEELRSTLKQSKQAATTLANKLEFTESELLSVKQESEEYRIDASELATANATIISLEKKAAQLMTELSDTQKTAEIEQERAKQEIEELTQNMRLSDRRFESCRKQLTQQTLQDNQTASIALSNCQRSTPRLYAPSPNPSPRSTSVSQDAQQRNEKVKSLVENLKQTEKQLSTVNTRVSQLSAEYQAALDQLATLQAQSEDLTDTIAHIDSLIPGRGLILERVQDLVHSEAQTRASCKSLVDKQYRTKSKRTKLAEQNLGLIEFLAVARARIGELEAASSVVSSDGPELAQARLQLKQAKLDYEALETKLGRLKNFTIPQLELELSTLRQENSSLKGTNTQLGSECATLKASISQLSSELKESKGTNADLEAELEKNQDTIYQMAEASSTELSGKTQALKESLQEKTVELRHLQNDVIQKDGKISNLQSQLDELQKENEDLQKDLTTALSQIATVNESKSDSVDIDRFNRKLSELRESETRLQDLLQEKINENTSLSHRVDLLAEFEQSYELLHNKLVKCAASTGLSVDPDQFFGQVWELKELGHPQDGELETVTAALAEARQIIADLESVVPGEGDLLTRVTAQIGGPHLLKPLPIDAVQVQDEPTFAIVEAPKTGNDSGTNSQNEEESKSFNSYSDIKSVSTEELNKLIYTIKILEQENSDLENTIALQENSLKVLSQEQASNQRQLQSESATANVGYLKELFDKFARGLPKQKSEVESLLRVMLQMLEFSKQEMEEIAAARREVGAGSPRKPPKQSNLKAIFSKRKKK